MTTSLEDWVLSKARPPRLDILEQAKIPGAQLDYSRLESRDAFPLLSQACVTKFGEFEALQFQVKQTYGPRAFSATLTVTRPDDIGIEFPNSGGHPDSTQAKAHAALRAVQAGALRFIFDDENAPVGQAGPERLPEPTRGRKGARPKQKSTPRFDYQTKKRIKRGGKKHGYNNASAGPTTRTHYPPAPHSVAGASSSPAQPKTTEGPPTKRQKTDHVAPFEEPTGTQPELQITSSPSDRSILIEVHVPAGSAQPTVVQQNLEQSGSARCKIIITVPK